MLLQKLLWPRVGICTEDRLYYRMKAPSFRDEGDILRIEQGDHVIMFLTDKKFITDVERLFQPSPFFL